MSYVQIEIWAIVVTQSLVALAAGEVSIRYFSWYALLLKSKEKYTATPLILGIAGLTAMLTLIEIQWMTTRIMNAGRINVPEGFVLGILFRAGMFLFVCFLTYPVSKVHYKHSLEKAMVEMFVRVFLMAVSFLAGMECTIVYHCLMHTYC